jgi:hypothetical protein
MSAEGHDCTEAIAFGRDGEGWHHPALLLGQEKIDTSGGPISVIHLGSFTRDENSTLVSFHPLHHCEHFWRQGLSLL